MGHLFCTPHRHGLAARPSSLFAPNSDRSAINPSVIIRAPAFSTDIGRLRLPGGAGFITCTFLCLGSKGIRLLICALSTTNSGRGHVLVGSVLVIAHSLGRVRACSPVLHLVAVFSSIEMAGSATNAGIAPAIIDLGTSNAVYPMMCSPGLCLHLLSSLHIYLRIRGCHLSFRQTQFCHTPHCCCRSRGFQQCWGWY